jgi:hypothetical protein
MFAEKTRGAIHSSFYKGLGNRFHSRSTIFRRCTLAAAELPQPSARQPIHRDPRLTLTHIRRPGLKSVATMSGRVPIESQRVDAPLTSSATFLVLSVTDAPDAVKTVRSTLADIDGLAKNVAIRDLGASFACTVGIGSDVWDQVTGLPKPSELHPFPVVKGAKREDFVSSSFCRTNFLFRHCCINSW